jgi:hypothetical protein
VFSGISQDHTHIELVMELKHANSPQLKQGLTVQLPTYRADRGSDLAVYGILWYKGRDFDKPSHPSLSECLRELDGLRPPVVDAVCGFDVSRRPAASKVKRGMAKKPGERLRKKENGRRLP